MYTRKAPKAHLVSIHGYRVILHVTGVKMITVESAVRSGFMHETESTAGIHHLLEHVLTEGHKKCGASCSQFWKAKGVYMNANTDTDRMTYYTNGIEEDLSKMVEYIVAITDHPIMRATTVVKEKQAVIDELLTYGNDPAYAIDSAMNHLVYKNGAEFQDDWKLQIKNLKHLNLDDLKRLYLEDFTPSSVIFVVSGNFRIPEVTSLFQKHLKQIPHGIMSPNACFTYTSATKFIHRDAPTMTVIFAFPSDLMVHDAMLAPQVASLLTDILFYELRTKRVLVYNVHIKATTTTCGTLMKAKMHVRDENAREAIHEFLQVIKRYQSEPVPASMLQSMKKTETQRQAVQVPFANFYVHQLVSQLHEKRPRLYSPDDLLRAARSATARDVKRLIQRLFRYECMVIVAQGKTNHLTSISI